MKKIILVIVMFGLSGCATTNATSNFDPDSKTIHISNGKSYHAPHNTLFLPMDKKGVELFASAGIQGCNENDIVWVSEEYAKNNSHVLNGFSGNATKQWVQHGFNQHLMGCSSIMSDQELAYYSEQ